MTDPIEAARAEERERCAKIAEQAAEESFDRCESLGTMDPTTGVSECALEVRGKDCLCSHASEKANAVARAIRAAV